MASGTQKVCTTPPVSTSCRTIRRAVGDDDACKYCCWKGHGTGSNPKVRERLCLAFGNVCGKLEHYQQACGRKRKKT